MNKVRKYSIYVGLNDAFTHKQKFDTGAYASLLKNVCKSYHAAFSFHVENGGFFHEDGSYADENSLVLTLFDASRDIVNEIAKDLCAFFNQESVMVTSTEAEICFIHDDLKV